MLRSKSSIITWNGKKKKNLNQKKLILFIEEILIDAEHSFERLMQRKVAILDILIEFQQGGASQYSVYF